MSDPQTALLNAAATANQNGALSDGGLANLERTVGAKYEYVFVFPTTAGVPLYKAEADTVTKVWGDGRMHGWSVKGEDGESIFIPSTSVVYVKKEKVS